MIETTPPDTSEATQGPSPEEASIGSAVPGTEENKVRFDFDECSSGSAALCPGIPIRDAAAPYTRSRAHLEVCPTGGAEGSPQAQAACEPPVASPGSAVGGESSKSHRFPVYRPITNQG